MKLRRDVDLDTLNARGAARLPDGAESFTTIELKCNFLGTPTDGMLEAVARGAHLGRTTQVWDAQVSELASGRTLALLRCSQMVR